MTFEQLKTINCLQYFKAPSKEVAAIVCNILTKIYKSACISYQVNIENESDVELYIGGRDEKELRHLESLCKPTFELYGIA